MICKVCKKETWNMPDGSIRIHVYKGFHPIEDDFYELCSWACVGRLAWKKMEIVEVKDGN